jgi:BirA family biotin operon repressor/biotin-[acetyl-CoA-carboxylase] ligase
LEISYYSELDSTQEYLSSKIRSKELKAPIAVIAKHQTNGRGSRGNSWISNDGNLYLSFAISLDKLPSDLRIESASIYFAYILKEVLSTLGSDLYIKWPNDFYIDDKKIGGIITSKIADTLICGIGVNIVSSPDGFGYLDIDIEIDRLLELYFARLDKNISWQDTFDKYRDEFYKSKDLKVTIDDKKVSLSSAVLNSDGSISIDSKKIYSLR